MVFMCVFWSEILINLNVKVKEIEENYSRIHNKNRKGKGVSRIFKSKKNGNWAVAERI